MVTAPRWRATGGVAAALLATVVAEPARSEPQGDGGVSLEIVTRRCTWLDGDELVRLTRLELGAAATSVSGGLQVDFACAGDDVTIGLVSEQRAIRVERRVTGACCQDVDPERTLAILSSGLLTAAKTLFDASGERVAGETAHPPSESAAQTVVLPPVRADGTAAEDDGGPVAPTAVLAPPTPAPLPQPAAVPPATAAPPMIRGHAPAPTSWGADDVEPPAEPPVHEIGAGARLRLFEVRDPLTTYAATLDYRAWPWARFGVGAWAEAAFGSTSRIGGEVDTRVVQIGPEASWRPLVADPFTLRLSGRAGLAFVQLQGEASDPSSFGQNDTSGVTGSLGMVVSPTLRSGPSSIALPLEIGGLFRAPRGRVTGDDEVRLDGITFAAGLAVSYGWGRRPRARRWEARR